MPPSSSRGKPKGNTVYVALACIFGLGIVLCTNLVSGQPPSAPVPLPNVLQTTRVSLKEGSLATSVPTPTQDGEATRVYVLPPAGAVETAFIKRVVRPRKLRAKFKQICGQCKVTAEGVPEGASPSWRPPFCSAEEQPEPMYSFGARWVPRDAAVTAASTPDAVTAVFSLLGKRYYGPGGQEYVWEAVRQWRVFHPPDMSDVRVLIFDELASNVDVQRNATSLKVKLELMSSLSAASAEEKRFLRLFYMQGYMHPGGNRKTGHKDFNKLVTQRFYALMNLMIRDGLKNVVHLENDVMVYGDYRPVIRAFDACGNSMATLFPHDRGAIPGVLLVRNADALRAFVQYVNDLFSCGPDFGPLVQKGYANDMTYLLNHYELHGSRVLGDLPNRIYAAGENCLAEQLPGSIFDGAAFGQWYSFAIATSPAMKEEAGPAAAYGDVVNNGGTVTRAVKDAAMSEWVQDSAAGRMPLSTARPPQHIINAVSKHWLDPTPGTLAHWTLDDRGRRVPKYKDYQLYALHIHAKNLWWFRST